MKSGAAASKVAKCKFYNQLLFLYDQSANKPTESNVPCGPSSSRLSPPDNARESKTPNHLISFRGPIRIENPSTVSLPSLNNFISPFGLVFSQVFCLFGVDSDVFQLLFKSSFSFLLVVWLGGSILGVLFGMVSQL